MCDSLETAGKLHASKSTSVKRLEGIECLVATDLSLCVTKGCRRCSVHQIRL